MLGVELAGRTAVEESHALVQELLHPGRRELFERLSLGEQLPLVQSDDALEVRWPGREVPGQLGDEVAFVLDSGKAVEAALEADRRPRLLAHAGATAEGAADVSRPDLREVLELEQAPDRVVEIARACFRLDREVRPGEVAHEEGVARDHEPRRPGARLVLDHVRHVVRPVAGRGQGSDADAGDLHGIAVGKWLVLELDAGPIGDVDGGSRCRPKAPAAGNVVGVRVRLQDVRDLEAVLVRQGEVVLDVPLRIDDRRLSPVRDDVGGAAEILVQHLPEEHSARHDTAVRFDRCELAGAVADLGVFVAMIVA